MPAAKLWINWKNKKLVRDEETGQLVLCTKCPCICEPKVIASKITNRAKGRAEWDLRKYQNRKGLATPGAYWRIRDVGEAHHNDSGQPCSGTIYYNGRVNDEGVLEGLPDRFVSTFDYDGYMELQIGCMNDSGSIVWPCPNG